jgi:hypothetical protein
MESHSTRMVASTMKVGNSYLTRGGRNVPGRMASKSMNQKKATSPKADGLMLLRRSVLERQSQTELDLPLRTQRVHARSVAYTELVE